MGHPDDDDKAVWVEEYDRVATALVDMRTTLARERDEWRAERARLNAAVADTERAFELMRRRMGEATELWRKDKGEPDTVWPDVGEVVGHLLARIKAGEGRP